MSEDYVFGWTESPHNWVIFHVIKIGRACSKYIFQPYKLIGDAAYPVRLKIYCSYKGGNVALYGKEANWYFI